MEKKFVEHFRDVDKKCTSRTTRREKNKILDKIRQRVGLWDSLFDKYEYYSVSGETSIPIRAPEVWETFLSLKEEDCVNKSVGAEDPAKSDKLVAVGDPVKSGNLIAAEDFAKCNERNVSSPEKCTPDETMHEVERYNETEVSSGQERRSSVRGKSVPACLAKDLQSINIDATECKAKKNPSYGNNTNTLCNPGENQNNSAENVNIPQNSNTGRLAQEKVDSSSASELVTGKGNMLTNTTPKPLDVYNTSDFLLTNYELTEDRNIQLNYKNDNDTQRKCSKRQPNITCNIASVLKSLATDVERTQQMKKCNSNELKSVSQSTSVSTNLKSSEAHIADECQSANCDTVKYEDAKVPSCENNTSAIHKVPDNIINLTNNALANVPIPEERVGSLLLQENVNQYVQNEMISEEDSASINTIPKSTSVCVENDSHCTNLDASFCNDTEIPNFVRVDHNNYNGAARSERAIVTEEIDNCYGIELWGNNSQAIEKLLQDYACHVATSESPGICEDVNFQSSNTAGNMSTPQKFDLREAIKKWCGASKSIETMINEMCTCTNTPSKSAHPCANGFHATNFNTVECEGKTLSHKNGSCASYKLIEKKINPAGNVSTPKEHCRNRVEQVVHNECEEVIKKQENTPSNTTMEISLACVNVCQTKNCNTLQDKEKKSGHSNSSKSQIYCEDKISNTLKHLPSPHQLVQQKVKNYDNESKSERAGTSTNTTPKSAITCADNDFQSTNSDTMVSEDQIIPSFLENDCDASCNRLGIQMSTRDNVSTPKKCFNSQTVKRPGKNCGNIEKIIKKRCISTVSNLKSSCVDDNIQPTKLDTIKNKDLKASNKKDNRVPCKVAERYVNVGSKIPCQIIDQKVEKCNTNDLKSKEGSKFYDTTSESMFECNDDFQSRNCETLGYNVKKIPAYKNSIGINRKVTENHNIPIENLSSPKTHMSDDNDMNEHICKEEFLSTNTNPESLQVHQSKCSLSEHLKTLDTTEKEKNEIPVVIKPCWVHSSSQVSPRGNIPTPENCIFCRAVARRKIFSIGTKGLFKKEREPAEYDIMEGKSMKINDKINDGSPCELTEILVRPKDRITTTLKSRIIQQKAEKCSSNELNRKEGSKSVNKTSKSVLKNSSTCVDNGFQLMCCSTVKSPKKCNHIKNFAVQHVSQCKSNEVISGYPNLSTNSCVQSLIVGMNDDFQSPNSHGQRSRKHKGSTSKNNESDAEVLLAGNTTDFCTQITNNDIRYFHKRTPRSSQGNNADPLKKKGQSKLIHGSEVDKNMKNKLQGYKIRQTYKPRENFFKNLKVSHVM